MEDRNWIVMTGHPVNTSLGGGFEFFGPYSEEEAKKFQSKMVSLQQPGNWIAVAIQLLKGN
jgi:hypothetical protein